MPGLILIPSDLRILTKPIPGFSNVLTVAKNGMTFGKNEKVNYTSNPDPTPTNNIDESHDITPAPTVEDFKLPELRQKSDTQNIALGRDSGSSILWTCIPSISTLNKMSILFGYDYFDTTAEDLDILKQKLAVLEKGQQGNTAEVAKHTNDIIKLNSLGENTVQYDFSQISGYSPGFLQTPTITDTDKKNAKFIRFIVSDGQNRAILSHLYGFYNGSVGTVVLWTRDQSSRIIQVSFLFAITGDTTNSMVQIFGLESKDVDSSGNVTNRTRTTTINCSLLTT
jgi:hypothetical protein